MLTETVYFYCLSRKFVDKQDIPEQVKQVMYYSLTIGHHLGVVDCLDSRVSCSREEYQEWIRHLPEDSVAYQKFAGFLKFGEVTLLHEHINTTALALSKIDKSLLSEKLRQVTSTMMDMLQSIYQEPSMYIMIRGHNHG